MFCHSTVTPPGDVAAHAPSGMRLCSAHHPWLENTSSASQSCQVRLGTQADSLELQCQCGGDSSLGQTGASCGFLACCVTELSEVSSRGRREGQWAFLQARPAQPVRSGSRPEVPVHPPLCLLRSAAWLLPHVAPRVGGWPSVMGGVSAGRSLPSESQAAPTWSHVAACLSQASTSG